MNTRTLYIDTMRESLEVNLTKAANKEKEVETHNNNNEYYNSIRITQSPCRPPPRTHTPTPHTPYSSGAPPLAD